ncbi:hypothetical protein DPMN_122273 [Dreissena polymorpha]|uniref:Uncharacterized protein n=1 Tax=Dreissena polymorpha TaxID=45954 RepID=A0A9D4GS50_DREPO|nr:hypothetical protein DPMN_122273 [Dreissena polymorpha]
MVNTGDTGKRHLFWLSKLSKRGCRCEEQQHNCVCHGPPLLIEYRGGSVTKDTL